MRSVNHYFEIFSMSVYFWFAPSVSAVLRCFARLRPSTMFPHFARLKTFGLLALNAPCYWKIIHIDFIQALK